MRSYVASQMLLLTFVSFVVATMTRSVEKTDETKYLQRWIRHHKDSKHSAGVLCLVPFEDLDTVEQLSSLNNFLSFLVVNDGNVASELSLDFPAIYLVRDDDMLKIELDVSNSSIDEIDFLLNMLWPSTVTQLTLSNQVGIFSHMAPPTKVVLLSSSRADDLTYSTFHEVSGLWSSDEVRSDLPMFVYASLSELRADSNTDTSKDRRTAQFWDKLTQFVFGKRKPLVTQSDIFILHTPRGRSVEVREEYLGDPSSKVQLSGWVSTVLGRIRAFRIAPGTDSAGHLDL